MCKELRSERCLLRKVLSQALLSVTTSIIMNITYTWLGLRRSTPMSFSPNRRNAPLNAMHRFPKQKARSPSWAGPVHGSRNHLIHYPPLLRMKRRPLKALDRHITTLARWQRWRLLDLRLLFISDLHAVCTTLRTSRVCGHGVESASRLAARRALRRDLRLLRPPLDRFEVW